ncbi:hypothetical protein PHISCL_10776, partial [Aspergillus sclerotialis]
MATSEIVLNKQRNLLRQTELDLGRQVRGLAEVDEVLEGEGKGDGLGERKRNVLVGLVHVGMLADGDGAVPDIAWHENLTPSFVASMATNQPSQYGLSNTPA